MDRRTIDNPSARSENTLEYRSGAEGLPKNKMIIRMHSPGSNTRMGVDAETASRELSLKMTG